MVLCTLPYKNKKDQQKYHKRWYIRNKEKVKLKVIASNKKIRIRNRQLITQYKTNNPCKDCKKFYHFSAMQFDHVRGKKINNISDLANRQSVSVSKLLEEIEKCELVCANCHAIRTFKQRKKT